jgi:4-amino-4-deoxy-L-arabinose transferase-like glycosyltransferase
MTFMGGISELPRTNPFRRRDQIGDLEFSADDRRRRLLRVCVVLYLAAFGLRLGLAEWVGLDRPFPPPSDEQTFYARAENLAAGRGYVQAGHDGVLRPTAYQVPGAPLIMAAAIRVLGDSPRSIRLSAIAISSCSAPLMMLFALEMSTFPVAVLAGVGCAVYPSWVFFSITGYTEPIFIPFLFAALLLTALAARRRASMVAFVAGTAWGAAALVRPLAVPMAALVAGYFLWKKLPRAAFLLVVGCALLLAPWLTRNEIVFGHAVLANEGGETFLGSNNPYVLADPSEHGLWIAPWQIPEYRAVMAPLTNELQENKLEYKIGTKFLQNHPWAVPRLAFYKLDRWLTPVTHVSGEVRYMVLGSYGVLLLLLLLGVVRRSFHSSAALCFVLLWSLVLFGITVVYWGNLVRGRLPLELVWIPWGAVAGYDLLRFVFPKLFMNARESSMVGPGAR